jgi:penicillin-binding protein 1A
VFSNERTQGGNQLRVLCSDAFQRLREMDFSVGKVRATEPAARSPAIWSRIALRRVPSADTKSNQGSQRRRQTVLLWSTAAARAGCLVLLVVLFSWALSDVPWDEIADGSLKPVVSLKTPTARRW